MKSLELSHPFKKGMCRGMEQMKRIFEGLALSSTRFPPGYINRSCQMTRRSLKQCSTTKLYYEQMI